MAAVPQDCPPHPPLQMPMASAVCYLGCWTTCSKLEVSRTPSSVLIILLECVTRLRKPVYSLDGRLIIKGYNFHRGCIGEVWKRVWDHHAFSYSPSTSTCSRTLKLSDTPSFGFLWMLYYIAWLIKSSAVGDWFNLQPLLSPAVIGVGLKALILQSHG